MKKILLLGILVVFMFSCVVNAQIVDNPNLAASLVYQDPDPIEPGDYVDLIFSVKNEGTGSAKGVTFKLDPEFPFSMYEDGSDEKYVGDIGVYDADEINTGEVTVSYRVAVDPNAIEGLYDLELLYQTENEGAVGQWQTFDSFQLRIRTSEAFISVTEVLTEPERIRPGESAEVTFNVKNEGGNDLKDISIEIDTKNATKFSVVGTSNEIIISRLNSGEDISVQRTMIVDADAELKSYKVPLNMNYTDDSGNAHSKKIYVSMIVDSTPEYILNLEETEIYQAKNRGDLVISLSNVGAGDINYATLELKESEDYTILSADTIYLGNLEPDDYETAEFDIYVEEHQEYLPLLFSLSYKDNFNKAYVEDIELGMKLFSNREAAKYGLKEGGTGYFFIVIFVIAAGAIGYYYYFRRKKRKK